MSLPVRLFRVALEQTKAMISFQARSQLLRLCSVQTSYAQMQESLKFSSLSPHFCQMKWPFTRSITCPCTNSTSLASSLFPRASGHSLQASCLSSTFSTMADLEKRPEEMHEGVDAILDYWLGCWAASGFQGEVEASKAVAKVSLWFKKSQDTDDTIRSKFSSLLDQAVNGELQAWEATPHGTLALLILLDQFSRNMFRDTPNSFAQDPIARAITRRAIAKGFDKQVHPVATTFFYLPFEHSEDKEDQELAIQYFEALVQSGPDGEVGNALKLTLDFAKKHKVVIDKFGRYPHRNVILGRESTAQEVEYLSQPGSGF